MTRHIAFQPGFQNKNQARRKVHVPDISMKLPTGVALTSGLYVP
jgi:hypothetical protein